MADALPFPPLIAPKSVQWHQFLPSTDSPVSLGGIQQSVINDSGHWRGVATFTIGGEERTRLYRAFLSQLRGRSRHVLMPTFDRFRPLGDDGRRLGGAGPVPFAAAPDGRPLFGPGGTGRMIEVANTVTVAADAALRATVIQMEPVTAGNSWVIPGFGQYFGIGERLYLVERVWQATTADPFNVAFWPPLRAAVTEGDPVITHRPVCRVRLSDDAGARLALDIGNVGQVQIAFAEAL